MFVLINKVCGVWGLICQLSKQTLQNMLSKPAYSKPKKRVKPMKNALEEQKQLPVLSDFSPHFCYLL
jgi:hypothetical protein